MESNVYVKESLLKKYGIKWENNFINKYQFFMEKIFLKVEYPCFVYVIQDHYVASHLKESFLFSKCLSCNNEMISRAPENARAYTTSKCNHCGENHYVILYRTRERLSGYVALILNYFPEGLLYSIQPDKGFINPRSILVNSTSLQNRFYNDPIGYDNWYDNTFSKICKKRMKGFKGNLVPIEEEEIICILYYPNESLNNYLNDIENPSIKENANFNKYFRKIFVFKEKVQKLLLKTN